MQNHFSYRQIFTQYVDAAFTEFDTTKETCKCVKTTHKNIQPECGITCENDISIVNTLNVSVTVFLKNIKQTRTKFVWLLPVIFLISLSTSFAQNTYIVKDTSNTDDRTEAGMTLRGAVNLLNLSTSTITDTIKFDLPDGLSIFKFTPRGLSSTSAPYQIKRPVVIDGYSQGNLNVSTHTDPARIARQGAIGQRQIKIIIDGSALNPGTRIFDIRDNPGKLIVSGIAFNNLVDRVNGRAIDWNSVTPQISDTVHIWGCYFGTDASGLNPVPNTALSSSASGNILIRIAGQAINAPVYIGTNGDGINDENEGNLIANSFIAMDAEPAIGSSEKIYIAGNYFGCNANCSLTSDAIVDSVSILIRNGNVVVGIENATKISDTLKRNVICGSNYGIQVSSNTAPVIIAGNYIGVAKDGLTPIPNRRDNSGKSNNLGGYGILTATSTTNGIRIGTDGNNIIDTIERNIISGNQTWGISLSGNGHIVAGNYIGTDKSGMIAVPNGSSGISGNNDLNNSFTIGVSATSLFPAYERNVISANGEHGIAIRGNSHVIAGNYIGVGSDGITNLGNGQVVAQPGIFISGVTTANKKNRYIRIGTTGGSRAEFERNVIAYNKLHGITFNHGAYDTIAGNYIGVNAVKDAAGNLGAGIRLISCDSTIIGAPSAEYAPKLTNVIANNNQNGVAVSGTPADLYNVSRHIRISQNSFYKNRFLPIDLSYNNIVNLNDGGVNITTDATNNNLGLDYPIFTSYSVNSGGDINVKGFVGLCSTDSVSTNTTVPGDLSVELYLEDNDGDQNNPDNTECKVIGTSHGEGKIYLGTVFFTATSGGYNFNQTFTPDASISPATYTGKRLTGITIDNSGNTSEFGTTSFNIMPLPVKLISFNGVAQDQCNLLTWTTTAEISFSGFDIEYSANGLDYSRIGNVKADGSANTNKYSFIHYNVTGVAYYRLKCIDIDGRYTYSSIINVNTLAKSSAQAVEIQSVNPVPFISMLNINAVSERNCNVKLMLYDMNGRVCLDESIHVMQGTGVYRLNNLENLKPGVYTLRLTSDRGGTLKLLKVIKI